jgi:hypothetical protein
MRLLVMSKLAILYRLLLMRIHYCYYDGIACSLIYNLIVLAG